MTDLPPFRLVQPWLAAVFTLACLFTPSPVAAETPGGWRTDGSGRYPQANPPLEWATDKNVVWQAELPGTSHGTPVVVGRRVVVACEPADVLCFDTADGTLLWRKSTGYAEVFPPEKVALIEQDHARAEELRRQLRPLRRDLNQLQKAEDAAPDAVEQLERRIEEIDEQIKQFETYPAPRRGNNGNTTATPVSNGREVFVAFGTGIVTCLTLDGERVWTTFVQGPKLNFGHSASPVLVNGKLVLHYDNLVALDARTGKTVWTAEVPVRFGSPIASQIGDTAVIITAAGAVVRTDDGQVLAQGLFRLGHNSPVVHEGVVYACQSGANSAYRLPETDDGTPPELLWKARGFNQRTFASPLYHDGLLYTVTENNIMDAVDAATGQLVYRARLNFGNGRVYPSLSMAGNYLFASSDNGTTLVLAPGRDFRVLAHNTLDSIQGSLVFDGSRLYLRGKTHLYCIAEH